ncbi:hypothetical protein TNCV_4920361 [Trichonephila clavipes]|nr:hypothetical protein TNCV_4920361 [Trichonephila clavipes]
MSTKGREINPSKRKTKKLKYSGRNANIASVSDENCLAKEKNDLLKQINFLNSILLDTKLKETNKTFFLISVSSNDGRLPENQHIILDFLSLWSAHFQNFADCEVDSATLYCKVPSMTVASGFERKRKGKNSDGKGQREKGHENDRRRLDRKGNGRISTKPLYFFKNNESQLGNV